jgi:putative SOS response-associated peptidase YedK
MCGRYTLRDPLAAARALLRLGMDMPPPEEWQSRYNVAPTQRMPVVRRKPRGGRQVESSLMRWGITLRPAGEEMRRLLINARSESAWQKPSFRASLQCRRCIIPADGFFEWKRIANGSAKARGGPYFVRRRDDSPMWLAGFFEEPAGGDHDPAYVILTTAPNTLMAAIHDRMPVILTDDFARAWLGAGGIGATAISALCVPWPSNDLVAATVGPAVNDAGNDHPGCIAPDDEVKNGDTQGMLPFD